MSYVCGEKFSNFELNITRWKVAWLHCLYWNLFALKFEVLPANTVAYGRRMTFVFICNRLWIHSDEMRSFADIDRSGTPEGLDYYNYHPCDIEDRWQSANIWFSCNEWPSQAVVRSLKTNRCALSAEFQLILKKLQPSNHMFRTINWMPFNLLTKATRIQSPLPSNTTFPAAVISVICVRLALEHTRANNNKTNKESCDWVRASGIASNRILRNGPLITVHTQTHAIINVLPPFLSFLGYSVRTFFFISISSPFSSLSAPTNKLVICTHWPTLYIIIYNILWMAVKNYMYISSLFLFYPRSATSTSLFLFLASWFVVNRSPLSHEFIAGHSLICSVVLQSVMVIQSTLYARLDVWRARPPHIRVHIKWSGGSCILHRHAYA